MEHIGISLVVANIRDEKNNGFNKNEKKGGAGDGKSGRRIAQDFKRQNKKIKKRR